MTPDAFLDRNVHARTPHLKVDHQHQKKALPGLYLMVVVFFDFLLVTFILSKVKKSKPFSQVKSKNENELEGRS